MNLRSLIETTIGSKKLAGLIAGLIVQVVVLACTKFGLVAPDDTVILGFANWVSGILIAYVLGQGIADMGKEAAVLDLKAEEVSLATSYVELEKEKSKTPTPTADTSPVEGPIRTLY